MLKLDNNRKALYQWDVGVIGTLTIDGVDEVHFSNLRYGVSFNIKVVDNKVELPPEVLQSGADVFCWAFVREENGGYTKKEQIFNVEKRPRPADYVYEPTEILSWEALKKEIEKLDEDTTEALADLEKGTLKVEDVITDTSTDPTNKYQVFSAEVVLETTAELVNMMSGCEKVEHKLTEYTEVETDEQYYSAKATNEMFLALNQVFDIYDEAYNEKFATKDELNALKTEIQGDLDEIGDLIGGETGDSEVVTETIITEGTYAFDDYSIIGDGRRYYYHNFKNMPSATTATENDMFILKFNGETYKLSWSFVEGEPLLGNLVIMGAPEGSEYDTGENFCICYNDETTLSFYTTLPKGDYTVSLEKIVGGAE